MTAELFYLGISWIFGTFFLLIGLVSLINAPLAGLSFILISLLILPPIRTFVYLKTNKELSAKIRARAIFILFTASVFFFWQSQERKAEEIAIQKAKEQAERVVLENQANIDYFNANSSQILSEAKIALESKDYRTVISLSSKYLTSGNNELAAIHAEAIAKLAEARAKLAEIQKAEERKRAETKAELAEIQKAEERRQIAEKEAAYRQSLQCWGDKFSITAASECKNHVERLAKYSYEWTDGIFEPKFSHFRWKNQEAGIITYIGDKIKFQNGFGAWQNYVYECDFDTNAKIPVSVKADPGRY